jgi:hypothetical protein
MSLNVTVTPGHTFTDNETVTTGKLNAAAEPTVAVSGSIDASELGASSVGSTQLAAESVIPSKMGVSSLSGPTIAEGFTMREDIDSSSSSTTYNKKGVMYVTGAINNTPTGQYEELFAGTPNNFLIGSAKKTDGSWTGDWSVKSKSLNSGSSIFVDQQDDESFTMLIKENAITKSMMQGQSIGNEELGVYSVTLDKITPGGGAASNNSGGIAKDSNDFWGGIIGFNPANKAGETGWHGRAEALQANAKNQVVYSQGIQQSLLFRHHPCIPKAFAMIRANGEHAGATDYNSSSFTIVHSEGISEIQKVNSSSNHGEYKVKLTSGYETMFGTSANGVGDIPDGVITGTQSNNSDTDNRPGLFGVVTGAIDGNREFTIKCHWHSDGASLHATSFCKPFDYIKIELY